jgi:hypothetical protein
MVAAGQRILASDFPGIQTWTPTIGQGATTNIAKTVNEARYVLNQGWLTGAFHVQMTGTGTASNAVTATLPAAVGYAGSVAIGHGYFVDSSSGIIYPVIAYRSGTSTATMLRSAAEGTAPFLGSNGFTAALASGDQFTLNLSYRAA